MLHLSQEFLLEMKRLYVDKGKTLIEVADLLNVSMSTVYKNLNAMGVDTTRKSKSFSFYGTSFEECKKAYEVHKTVEKASQEMGISKTTFTKLMKEENFNFNSQGYLQRVDIDLEEARKLYEEENYTYKMLSEKYCLGVTAIKRKLNSIGVVSRKAGKVGKHSNFNHKCFDGWESNIKAQYYLGLLFADGTLSKDNVILTLHERDLDVLESYREFVGQSAPLKRSEPNGSIQYRCNLHSRYVHDQLEWLGCGELKSKKNYEINSVLADSKHFWRGFMDGDGFISSKPKYTYPYLVLGSPENYLMQFHSFVCRHISKEAKLPYFSTSNVKGASFRFEGTTKLSLPILLYLYTNLYKTPRGTYLSWYKPSMERKRKSVECWLDLTEVNQDLFLYNRNNFSFKLLGTKLESSFRLKDLKDLNLV